MSINQTFHSKMCSGCRKEVEIEDSYQQCEPCRKRGQENREKTRQILLLPENRCAMQTCKFKKSIENKYCMKHQLQIFIDNVNEMDKKCCNRYTRGCRTILEKDYEFSRCEPCRIKERTEEKERRNNKKENIISTKSELEKICIECNHKYPTEQFIGMNCLERERCFSCRQAGIIQDQKRDKEHRKEMSKIYESKPERKENHQIWAKNNMNKKTETWIRSRVKKRKENIQEFLKKNAERSKEWRERNPEKTKKYNEERFTSIYNSFINYKRNAIDKNLVIDELLTNIDIFTELVKQPCYYCKLTQEDKGFNGIDRKNCYEGYILSNCVSCCRICNYMKGTLDPITFYKRISHIISNNNWLDICDYYPESFDQNNSMSYSGYKSRAKAKNVSFELTKEMFNEIIDCDCYLCGKPNSDTNKNGIDRYDNEQGYTEDNSATCCSDCNLMKNKFSMEQFVNKCLDIYTNIDSDKDKYMEENKNIPIILCAKIVYLNKKSQDEKKETREKLISETTDKYTDDYIQTHAQSLVSNSISNPLSEILS